MGQQFAHISDPHLSSLEDVRALQLFSKRLLGYLSWRRKRRFEHRREVLEALGTDLQRDFPDQLVISGDLTHIGLPEEFEQARDWLQDLGAPEQVALVAGNHDACVKLPWGQGLALWADYLRGDVAATAGQPIDYPTLRRRGDISFIGLNSACPTAPLMATGTLGTEQLSALGDALDEARKRGSFRVVYLHHCPLPGVDKWRKRLTDAPELQNLLQHHGAELILHGHGHRSLDLVMDSHDGEIPVLAVPSASALGRHSEPAAYNRFWLEKVEDGWQLDIERRSYEGQEAGFVHAGLSTLKIRRSLPPPSPVSP